LQETEEQVLSNLNGKASNTQLRLHNENTSLDTQSG
jgi:hypothetical protein